MKFLSLMSSSETLLSTPYILITSLGLSCRSQSCSVQTDSFLFCFLGSEERGEFHISRDASRQISVFSPRWKERSRVSSEIFNDLNFKMQLIQGKFQ